MLESIKNFSLEYSLNIDRQALESQMKIEEIAKKYRGKDEEQEDEEDESEEGNGKEQEDDMFGSKKRKKLSWAGSKIT